MKVTNFRDYALQIYEVSIDGKTLSGGIGISYPVLARNERDACKIAKQYARKQYAEEDKLEIHSVGCIDRNARSPLVDSSLLARMADHERGK